MKSSISSKSKYCSEINSSSEYSENNVTDVDRASVLNRQTRQFLSNSITNQLQKDDNYKTMNEKGLLENPEEIPPLKNIENDYDSIHSFHVDREKVMFSALKTCFPFCFKNKKCFKCYVYCLYYYLKQNCSV